MRQTAKVALLLIFLLPACNVLSMPLRPDLLRQVAEEGRVDEIRQILQAERLSLEVPEEIVLPGSIRILVLLVDFDDVPADTIAHSKGYFNRMLFSKDEPQSMRNYYLANSYGKLDMTGEIYGWYRVEQPMSYYADGLKGMGYYPNNAQKMVEDAVDLADADVDFSLFDNDGPDGLPNSGDDDGKVDYLLVVHAGQGYEWTMNLAHIHSHAATIRARPVDGVTVRPYATEPEYGKVGTFAHELGHLLGLPDLYDITLNSYGLGMWSLMSYGSWGGGDGSRPIGLDAWSKVKLGFIPPVVLDTNLVSYHLPCVEDGPHVLRLWSEGVTGPQYFLVENRRTKSYDSYLSRFGEGLLVYHVDERLKDNSSESKHLVSLEQADGKFDLERRRNFGFGSDAGDPFPGSTKNREFSWHTVPDDYSNEGTPTQVSLRNISDSGDTMTFDAEVFSPVILFEDYLIDDRSGDGDGEPDPGEEIILGIRLRNHGISCADVVVRVETEDPYIQPSVSIAALGYMSELSISDPLGIPITIAENIPEPYEIDFEIGIEGSHDLGHYASADRFVLAVPVRRLAGWPRSTTDLIFSSPCLADLDGDGTREILLGCHDGKVYAWRIDGTLMEGWPVMTGDRVTSVPAVCDIDVDGNPEVVVSSQNGRVYLFRTDGSICQGWPQATGGQIVSSAVLADIDDDGMVEIISASKDGKVYAWNEDGMLLEGWPVELGGYAVWMSPGAADLDGDHISEIVVGGYGGNLYLIDGDSSIPDGWPVPLGAGCGMGSPCIADFDGDGSVEIVVSGLFSNSVYLVGADGTIKPGWPKWTYHCESLSSPIPADIDNDGLPEITVSTSCGTIMAWNGDGSTCKSIAAQTGGVIEYCEPVFIDLDGNATIEGIVGTASGAQSGVFAFGGEGALLGFPIQVDGEVWATPAVQDIDADGNAEIAVATTAGEVHLWRFIGAKGSGRVEWPQSRGDIWNTGYYGFRPHDNMPLPDLAMSTSDITFEPEKPRQGQDISIKVRVENGGHALAEDFRISVFYDVISDSTLIDAISVGSLQAKSDTTVSFAWPVPGGESTRLIHVVIDGEDGVLERSELNNQARRRFYLSLADLAVGILQVRPSPVLVGDSVSVVVYLRNDGWDVARDFVVTLYDSVVDESRLFAAFALDSIAPGDSLVLSARYRIERFHDDLVRIWAAADWDSQVLEYYRSNNICKHDINSGIEGEILVTPYMINVGELNSSRTSIAVEMRSSSIVFVSLAEDPFDVVFQTMGEDIDISRNIVVVSSEGDISGFDIGDSIPFAVSSEPGYETQPAVWGGNIVWVSIYPESIALRYMNAAGSVETIRSTEDGVIRNPDVSGDLVVWEEIRGKDFDVLGYDLETDSIIVICDDEGDQINPVVWGNTVVWEDRSDGASEIRCLDADSGERLNFGHEGYPQRNPVVYGDMVVWQDMRLGNWDIFGYSLASDVEFPISRQKSDQVLPTLSDSTVFWVDRREPNETIRGLKFGGIRSVATVHGFEGLSQDGQIRIVVNAQEHDDGITYRLYRYPDGRPMPDDRYTHLKDDFELGKDPIHVFVDTLVAARRPFFYTLGIVDGYDEETFYGPIDAIAYERTPKRFAVGNPFPNPFRYRMELRFGLARKVQQAGDVSWPDPSPDSSPVEVAIYSVTGRLVRVLSSGAMVPGYYRVAWDGTDDRALRVSPGVYFMTISVGGSVTSRKVILIR